MKQYLYDLIEYMRDELTKLRRENIAYKTCLVGDGVDDKQVPADHVYLWAHALDTRWVGQRVRIGSVYYDVVALSRTAREVTLRVAEEHGPRG